MGFQLNLCCQDDSLSFFTSWDFPDKCTWQTLLQLFSLPLFEHLNLLSSVLDLIQWFQKFSVSRTSTDFVWVHWFSLQGHLCHVASLPVILWNHGELICRSCHNIYLASRIPLLLGAFFPFGSICKMVLREVVLLPFDPFSELHKAL